MQKQLRKSMAPPLKMQPGGELLQAFGTLTASVHLLTRSDFDVKLGAGPDKAGEGLCLNRQTSAP